MTTITCHQLWFAGMTKMRGPRSGSRLRASRPASATNLASTALRPADGGQLQLNLPGPGRTFDWAQHAEHASPALARTRRIAHTMGETYGWNAKLVAELDRALVILLSGHADGEPNPR